MSFKGSSIIYIFLFALLCACNKVELPDEQGPGTQPVLTTSMNIDGMAVDISAGLNDYVLHTGYELSDYNVLSMKSTFETIDHCDPTCASTLSVTLNAPLPYVQGQAFDVMDNIFVGDYPFAFDPILGQGDSLYMVYGFYSASFYSDLEIQWRRGNGPFMTLDGSVMFLIHQILTLMSLLL